MNKYGKYFLDLLEYRPVGFAGIELMGVITMSTVAIHGTATMGTWNLPCMGNSERLGILRTRGIYLEPADSRGPYEQDHMMILLELLHYACKRESKLPGWLVRPQNTEL